MSIDRPINIAYHYLGCVARRDDRLVVPSLHGPLIEALAEVAGHVTIVAWDAPDGTPNPSNPEDRVDYTIRSTGRIDVLSLGPKGTWRDALTRSRTVARVVREPSAAWDVLVLRLPNRRMAATVKASRCARLVCIDGSVLVDEQSHIGMSLLSRWRRRSALVVSERSARRVIAGAGLVLVNSEMLAARHRPVSRDVHVMRWSLRREAHAFRPADRFDGAGPHLVVVGRVDPVKGVFDALTAFAILKRTAHPDAHLHFVGEGYAMDALRAKVNAEGLGDAVTFHGWVESGEPLFSLFRRMDVALHLSYADSFPRVVWELLAHGVLVVCTPVGGIPENLIDGTDACFVPTGDAQAAADAVVRLASDRGLRQRLIDAGYDKASETSVERVSALIVGLMRQRWPELAT